MPQLVAGGKLGFAKLCTYAFVAEVADDAGEKGGGTDGDGDVSRWGFFEVRFKLVFRRDGMFVVGDGCRRKSSAF